MTESNLVGEPPKLRAMALSNIYFALQSDNYNRAMSDGMAVLERNQTAVGTAIAVLQYLDDAIDCPCPYLDSLEDEDEDFCECGCGEEEESVEDFVSYLDPSFDPTFGTFLIFCKN